MERTSALKTETADSSKKLEDNNLQFFMITSPAAHHAGIAQSVQRLATGWTAEGTELESR
jgi:hypothetical protein